MNFFDEKLHRMRAKDAPINVNLYTNTVLDGCVTLCVCPFAIETIFPLANFKTKHIFGILTTLRMFLSYGAPQGP